MAKVGEGDPRWLVQEREDGTNVNNWHWTEKDCTPWAKGRLTQLLENQVIVDNSEEKVETTTFEESNVEVSINTRKGKIFYFFEIDFKLKWEARKKNDSSTQSEDEKKKNVFKGTINLPGLSEETEEDMEVTVSREGGSNDAEYFRKRIEQSFVPQVRDNLRLILKELREEKTPKMKVPSSTSVKINQPTSEIPSTSTKTPTTSTSTSTSTATVSLQSEFSAPPSVIFDNLLDQGCVSAFTHSSCQIERKAGGKFSLLNGSITGEIIELQTAQLIKQKWRFSDWNASVFSIVTMELKPSGSGCVLHLKQTGVPKDDKSRVHNGWEEVFFSRLRRMMGYGGSNF